MTPRVIRGFFFIMLASTLALFAAGCSTTKTYEVKVDAISGKPAETVSTSGSQPQSYTIKSKNPAVGDESLRYREAADYVRTALSSKGLYEAQNQDRADMIVELDYGLEKPRTKIKNVSLPVYAQTGGGVRYEQVPVSDTRGNISIRTVAVYEPPRSEIIGYDDAPREVTMYDKYLRLTARENKPASEGRAPTEFWSVNVSAEDESKDLRKYLPILASATAEYVGKDTTNEQTVKIKDPSQLTTFIRKGMNDAPSTAAAQTAVQPKS